MGSHKEIQMLNCLGKHGPYSFFKSIKLSERVLTLACQFPVRIYPDSTILSIAEVQLLWTDRNESFCSLKLYFLPENTPDGRHQHHGEDEVIALQDTVIIRASDLMTWLVEEKEWDWGLLTPPTASSKAPTTKLSKAFANEKFSKQEKDKEVLHYTDYASSKVVVLNYERYIRLRTMLKRLEGSPDIGNWMSNPVVLALGGLPVGPNCRVLFAKEVFDYPELEDHELLCNHMAPKLKGKQKKRKRKRNPSLGSDSNASESSSNGSSGSTKPKRSVNGLGKERNDAFKFDVNELAKLYSQGILTSADFKDGILKPNSAVMKKIADKFFADSVRMGSNGRIKTENSSRGYSSTSNRSTIMPSRKIKGERGARGGPEMLGPDLSELAQKLEKSNALQILPIRPSVIQKQDAFQDEYQRKKRVKTESSQSYNGDITARLFHVKPETDLLSRYCSGPYSRNMQTVYGSPGIRSNITRPEKSFNSELQSQSVTPGKETQKKKTSITAMELDEKKEKIRPIRFASPSIFVPTSRIYGDPISDRKRGLQVPNSELGEPRMDPALAEFTAKSRRHNFDSQANSAAGTSSSVPKEDLLDLSEKEEAEAASKQMYRSLADIPPPNAMNQLGMRLTSEVTLFPSNLLSGFVGTSLKEPKESKSSKPSNSQSSASTSARSSKSSKWEQKMAPESHTQRQMTSSAVVPGNPKSMFVGDPRHDMLAASSASSAKYQGQSSSRGSRKSEPAHSSTVKESMSNANTSSSSKQSGGQSQHSRDKARDSLLQLNMQTHMGQRAMPPAMFPKMDPSYLHLFPHMFMPPSGMGGLGFPGMLGLPPGALEQIQLYQELIQKGLVPQFPGWHPDNAQDRGQK